jgi:hypothetical protein
MLVISAAEPPHSRFKNIKGIHKINLLKFIWVFIVAKYDNKWGCFDVSDRFGEQNFLSWLHKDVRKPLVLRGARQVGKSTLVREFQSSFGC